MKITVPPSQFDLTRLRYFVAVAEELNFRRAAKRMAITQPPLSRHIKLLEETLGVDLFARTNRSVRLTAAGERFLHDALDLLQRAEQAALHARQAGRGEAGTVRLGFIPSATIEVIPRLVTRLAREMPDVHLAPCEMMTVEQTEALMAGTLELGLLRLPPRPPAAPLEKVWSEDFVLAVPKAHPLAHKPGLCLEDLNDVDYVGYSMERGGFLHDVLAGMFGASGVAPKTVYSVAQAHTVMSLVNTGCGVGIVPRSNRLICMGDTAIREMELPKSFRSDIYMGLAPAGVTVLTKKVAHVIRQELALGPTASLAGDGTASGDTT